VLEADGDVDHVLDATPWLRWSSDHTRIDPSPSQILEVGTHDQAERFFAVDADTQADVPPTARGVTLGQILDGNLGINR